MNRPAATRELSGAEADRIHALKSYGILDSAAEEIFDEITDLAASICESPMALITFVDEHRAWFKSRVGIAETETPRDISFCTYGILQDEMLVVPDASKDERFRDNPLVTGGPMIRFYAGAQLRGRDGNSLGMICVLDTRPRDLRPSQLKSLRVLARVVMSELELRRHATELRRLEVESASLRLLRSMSTRLLHEVGNALVPLSTHQQLLGERYNDPDFRASLDAALSTGVRRVFRLVRQMRHLAEELDEFQPVSLHRVLEAAWASAKSQGPAGAALNLHLGSDALLVSGDPDALAHAFSEVIINAIQANPSRPTVEVQCSTRSGGQSAGQVVIDVHDHGDGFLPENVDKATQPFFTTRNVGPGLGLAVARNVIEKHHGHLEIRPSTGSDRGGVRICLPLLPTAIEALTQSVSVE